MSVGSVKICGVRTVICLVRGYLHEALELLELELDVHLYLFGFEGNHVEG